MRRFAPVDFTRVRLTGAFWAERLDTVLGRTIPSQHKRLAEHGILESLLLLDPPPPLRIPRDPRGHTHQVFWDSDLGKWIEAASYAIQHRRDDATEARIEAIVDGLEAAQMADGYLNLWFQGHEIDRRWTNLRDRHELYNCGHLLEGAIAYLQATGRRRLLDVMERYLDHIRGVFGRGESQRRGYPGHPELELALLRLFHLTGDRRHLDLASYFVEERGQAPPYFDGEARLRGEDPAAYHQGTHDYAQAHRPVREQDEVVGHAVRAFYLYAAMADLAADTGDASLKAACETLWADATGRRMYVTGGFGPSASNEGFTAPYDLPNDTAYAETCASVAMVFWARRMLDLDLDGAHADVMERALYNGALAGLSREGTHYFYDNKLQSDGSHRRWPWHPCPCCTMNVSRLLASVGGYVLSVGEGIVAVHLYGGAVMDLAVDGRPVRLIEESRYPWDGRIRVAVEADFAFELRLRIPGWCEGASVRLNGEPVPMRLVTGYLAIRRDWRPGDLVELDLPMPPRRVWAHPAVRADRGQVALARGPLVYCVEQADQSAPVPDLVLPREAPLTEALRDDLWPGGAVVIEAPGLSQEAPDGPLYRETPPEGAPATLTAVPYFLWANREPGAMAVWLPEA